MTSAVVIHEEDAGILLVFVVLLILVIMTIWGLKKKRSRLVHETGLALVYGLIIGALIRYVPKGSVDPADQIKQESNMTCLVNNTAPMARVDDVITVNINSSLYSYKLEGQLDDKQWQYRFSDELNKITFDPELFFNVLLPPIIFNAGYSMKKRHFFRNIGAISMFGLLVDIKC